MKELNKILEEVEKGFIGADHAETLIVDLYANQSKWISVKDFLPTPYQNVLAICNGKVEIMGLAEIRENGDIFKVWAMVYDGLEGDAIYDEDYGVTHWQPIPKP